MKKIRLVFLIMLTGLVAACSTPHNSAPVVERTQAGVKTVEASKPNANASKNASKTDNRGYYTVKKGDTLVHIALELGQNYRDIIAWNNLTNPNDIKVDQVLRVLPPEPGSVMAGPQTGNVAVNSGVEARSLSTTPTNSAPNKTAPRGDKRIYSETALSEMQKSDANGAPMTAAAGKNDAAKAAEAKSGEKQAEASNGNNADEETLSWIWPAEGKIVGTFEQGKKGIDIAGKIGQQVLAAGSGKVMYAGSGIRGYGNLVIVKHTNNLLSAYAHNKTILVKEGQTVNKGQKIAEMGSSDSDAVKLHFEIRQQGKPVDPSKFLPNR
jgi:lipoprotein NlpD